MTLPPAAPLTVRVPSLADSRVAAGLSITAAGGAPWSQVVPGGTLQSSWPLAGGTVTVPDLPAGAWQLQVTAVDGRGVVRGGGDRRRDAGGGEAGVRQSA